MEIAMNPFSNCITTFFSNGRANISLNSLKSFMSDVSHFSESQPTLIWKAVPLVMVTSTTHLNTTTKASFKMKLHVKRRAGCDFICQLSLEVVKTNSVLTPENLMCPASTLLGFWDFSGAPGSQGLGRDCSGLTKPRRLAYVMADG